MKFYIVCSFSIICDLKLLKNAHEKSEKKECHEVVVFRRNNSLVRICHMIL